MKKKKGVALTMVLCGLLVAVLAVGGTLAWMTTTTETKTNSFSVASGTMKATLTEPAFTAAEKAKANKLKPGDIINKDPTVTNTTAAADGTSEWVGLKLTFTKGDGTTQLNSTEMALLLRVISYTINANWMGGTPTVGTTDQNRTFYYTQRLAAGGSSTNPLFSSVRVLSSAPDADLTTIKDSWNGFKILINGGAVQGDIAAAWAGNESTIRAEIDALIP